MLFLFTHPLYQHSESRLPEVYGGTRERSREDESASRSSRSSASARWNPRGFGSTDERTPLCLVPHETMPRLLPGNSTKTELIDRGRCVACSRWTRRQSRRRSVILKETRKSASGTPFLDFAYTRAISIPHISPKNLREASFSYRAIQRDPRREGGRGVINVGISGGITFNLSSTGNKFTAN